jgi:hypothetical protein
MASRLDLDLSDNEEIDFSLTRQRDDNDDPVSLDGVSAQRTVRYMDGRLIDRGTFTGADDELLFDFPALALGDYPYDLEVDGADWLYGILKVR